MEKIHPEIWMEMSDPSVPLEVHLFRRDAANSYIGGFSPELISVDDFVEFAKQQLFRRGLTLELSAAAIHSYLEAARAARADLDAAQESY